MNDAYCHTKLFVLLFVINIISGAFLDSTGVPRAH